MDTPENSRDRRRNNNSISAACLGSHEKRIDVQGQALPSSPSPALPAALQSYWRNMNRSDKRDTAATIGRKANSPAPDFKDQVRDPSAGNTTVGTAPSSPATAVPRERSVQAVLLTDQGNQTSQDKSTSSNPPGAILQTHRFTLVPIDNARDSATCGANEERQERPPPARRLENINQSNHSTIGSNGTETPAQPRGEPNTSRPLLSPAAALPKHILWGLAVVAATVVSVIIMGSNSDNTTSPTKAAPPSSAAPYADAVNNTPSPTPLSPVTTVPTTTIKVTASDGAEGDMFGQSVAIDDGDTTIVIGSLYDTTSENGNDSGSVYVFNRQGNGWTEQTKLLASDGATEDRFGGSVAIHGDTIVIGASGDNMSNTGNSCGSVYVYIRSGTAWTEQAKLRNSDPAAKIFFGWSVAIHQDTVVVGALSGDTSRRGTGNVFVRSGTVWTEQAQLKAGNDNAGSDVGCSVAIYNDTIVIGDRFGHSKSSFNSGTAYVYIRSGESWTDQAKLSAKDGAVGDEFGGSVFISGETIVVSAPKDDTSGESNTGSVYVYDSAGTAWTEQAKLTASDPSSRDMFGYSVAIDGDTIAIGAQFGNAESIIGSGAVYVYMRSGIIWAEQDKLTATDSAAGDQFGNSVAMCGDTIVIGAFLDESVYIFERN